MNDCPNGRMSNEKMKEMFATTVSKSKVFCILLWKRHLAQHMPRFFLFPHPKYIVVNGCLLWNMWMSSSMLCQNLQGCSGDQFVDQLFRVFDRDGDGGIDFKVWILKTKSYFFLSRSSSSRPTCAAPATQRRNSGQKWKIQIFWRILRMICTVLILMHICYQGFANILNVLKKLCLIYRRTTELSVSVAYPG